MSKNFDKVKYYYDNYLNSKTPSWDLERVRKAVEKGWITKQEFKIITNEDY